MGRYRYLFEQLVRRELRQKYQGSALGIVWYLVNPLVLMGAYTLMFTYVLKSPVADVHDYPVFILIGIVVWTFFSGSLTAAAGSLLDQGSLIRKASFPRETIPAATVTVQFVTFAVLLVLVGAVSLAVRGNVDVSLLTLPFTVACLYGFALGLALAVSVLHAYFRDVAPILGAVLLPWFFISPVFFSPDDFPGSSAHHWVEPIVRWVNPVAPFIEGIRKPLFDGAGPGWGVIAYVAIAAVIALVVGRALFRRMQGELAVVL